MLDLLLQFCIFALLLQFCIFALRLSLESGQIQSSEGKEEPSVQRPQMSYSQLIAEALMTSADRRLALNDIYSYICAHHTYYRLVLRAFFFVKAT